MPEAFKYCLEKISIAKAFYSVGEFMSRDWDTLFEKKLKWKDESDNCSH